MKKKLVAMIMVCVLGAFAITACGDEADTAATETKEVVETENEAEVEVEASDDAEASEDDTNISYVDGFYATDADGNDFMIAFFEGDLGDIAFVKDASDEVTAEYTVEKAALDDGTEYLLVTVGATQIGYYEDGDDIYLVDDDGTVYGAARLTEEEADALYQEASK